MEGIKEVILVDREAVGKVGVVLEVFLEVGANLIDLRYTALHKNNMDII